LSDIDVDGVFSALPTNTRERCPLLFDVLDTLLLHKTGGREVSEMRVRSAVHSLAILIILRIGKFKMTLNQCLLACAFLLALVCSLSVC